MNDLKSTNSLFEMDASEVPDDYVCYVSALFLLLNWRHSHLPKEVSFNMLLTCKMGTTVCRSNGFFSVLQNDVFSVIFDYFFFLTSYIQIVLPCKHLESGHCFFFSIAHKVYNEKLQCSPLSLSIHNNQFFSFFLQFPYFCLIG